MTIDELLEAAEEYARRILINKKDAQLVVTFLIECPEKTLLVKAPWSNSKQRIMALEMMKFIMKEESATCYSVVSEAWMAKESLDPKKRSGLMPSKREDKKEVVIIVAVNKEEKQSTTFDIIRGNDGIITDIVKCGEMSKEYLGGDLVVLLDD
jgi:hypothetical protein